MSIRLICPLIASLIIAVTGCDRTLVYGERSGFNLGISVTPSENLPIEVNAGIKRRVIGIIPPTGEPQNGHVNGEAVNMFSRFDVQHEPSATGALFGTHTVSSAFASGRAATVIAESSNAEKVVAAIVNPKVITLDNTPKVAKVRKALLAYINGSPQQKANYLKLAENRGIPLDLDPLAALSAIANPTHANENLSIADQLGLLD